MYGRMSCKSDHNERGESSMIQSEISAKNKKIKILTGNHAAAYAFRQAKVGVISAYPITPQSPVVEKILGYKPEELVGKKHFYDLFAPDVKEKLKKAAFEVFARKEPFRCFTNPNTHKNGSVVILETNGTPIADDKGNLCGYRGADRDITERKKAEMALEKLNRDLETTVQQLSRSNRQLQDFVHVVAHDLKTPLGLITGYAEIAEADCAALPDTMLRHYLEKISRSARKMSSIIDELLLLAQVRQSEVDTVPLDMDDIVASAQQRLADAIEVEGHVRRSHRVAFRRAARRMVLPLHRPARRLRRHRRISQQGPLSLE